MTTVEKFGRSPKPGCDGCEVALTGVKRDLYMLLDFIIDVIGNINITRSSVENEGYGGKQTLTV